MAVPPSSPAGGRRKAEKIENKNVIDASPAKRSKNPGIRVQGGRIYDSENGKTCHQCRQKTMDFAASCKAMKREKPCTIKFCYKCLLNRYGEKAEEVSAAVDWKCPKCRGVCNCSFCMKRKGEQPTGILAYTAKLTGFSSVHDFLCRGDNVLRHAVASTKKVPDSKTLLVPSKRSRDKENHNVEKNSNVSIQVDFAKKGSLSEIFDAKSSKKLKQTSLKVEHRTEVDSKENKSQINNSGKELTAKAGDKNNLNGIIKNDELVKPPNQKGRPHKIATMPIRPIEKPMKLVAGVDLPDEDIGFALQFLEFCSVFSKVFDIKKGEPEAILRELARGSVLLRRSRVTSAMIRFQMRLLSLILEEPCLETEGENSWLKGLSKCLSQYKHLTTGLPLDFIGSNPSKYHTLDSSIKLRTLVFLCDEALCTEELRNFLDEENAKFAEERKERNEQVVAAKTKEKLIKQTLKNDLAKAMLPKEGAAQLSISAYEELISKIRQETERAHQEMLESVEQLPKKKHAPDAVRTSPLFLEKDGVLFWRLRSYGRSSSIMLQDSVENGSDKWFIFNDEDQGMIEKYISSLRCSRAKEQKELMKNSQGGAPGIKNESSSNPES